VAPGVLKALNSVKLIDNGKLWQMMVHESFITIHQKFDFAYNSVSLCGGFGYEVKFSVR
jgi:hypothetical protein